MLPILLNISLDLYQGIMPHVFYFQVFFISKCLQCSPHKCRVMPSVKLYALPLKSHVTRPRHRSPWECFGSRMTAARGGCPAPLNNRNPCTKGTKTPTKNRWASRLEVGRWANHPFPEKTGLRKPERSEHLV